MNNEQNSCENWITFDEVNDLLKKINSDLEHCVDVASFYESLDIGNLINEQV